MFFLSADDNGRKVRGEYMVVAEERHTRDTEEKQFGS